MGLVYDAISGRNGSHMGAAETEILSSCMNLQGEFNGMGPTPQNLILLIGIG